MSVPDLGRLSPARYAQLVELTTTIVALVDRHSVSASERCVVLQEAKTIYRQRDERRRRIAVVRAELADLVAVERRDGGDSDGTDSASG